MPLLATVEALTSSPLILDQLLSLPHDHRGRRGETTVGDGTATGGSAHVGGDTTGVGASMNDGADGDDDDRHGRP